MNIHKSNHSNTKLNQFLFLHYSTQPQMMTFAHDYKSFHLGPKAIFISDPFLNSSAASEEDDDIAKPLSIDGVLHSLFQTPSIELRQNRNLDEGELS